MGQGGCSPQPRDPPPAEGDTRPGRAAGSQPGPGDTMAPAQPFASLACPDLSEGKHRTQLITLITGWLVSPASPPALMCCVAWGGSVAEHPLYMSPPWLGIAVAQPGITVLAQGPNTDAHPLSSSHAPSPSGTRNWKFWCWDGRFPAGPGSALCGWETLGTRGHTSPWYRAWL